MRTNKNEPPKRNTKTDWYVSEDGEIHSPWYATITANVLAIIVLFSLPLIGLLAWLLKVPRE